MDMNSPGTIIYFLEIDSDPDDDPIVVDEIAVPPSRGTVENLEGVVRYTPEEGFSIT